ncbi:unnamed protein product [Symbiodinium sp. CCMP2456]|nr:unnamed protein product [Symbiodinium sp. CCMP2456]
MANLALAEAPSTQVDQEVGDILGAAVDTLFPGTRDAEMPQASHWASGKTRAWLRALSRQGQRNPTGSQEAGQDPGQSSEQGSDPRQWTRERTRQRQDEMWRQWESGTAWYQNEEIKKLRKEMGYLQEQMRLLARMSLRQEDELSQMRTERDFVLTFEPPTQAAEGNEANMLGLLFRARITTSLEQPEDREQLAMLKLLRQTEGGGMEWPYLRWSQEQLLEEAPVAALPHTDLMTALATLEEAGGEPSVPGYFPGIHRNAGKSLLCYRALCSLCFNASSQLLKLRIRPAKMERQPLAKVLAEHFPPPEMAMGRGKQGEGQGKQRTSPPRTSPSRQAAPKSPPKATATEGAAEERKEATEQAAS